MTGWVSSLLMELALSYFNVCIFVFFVLHTKYVGQVLLTQNVAFWATVRYPAPGHAPGESQFLITEAVMCYTHCQPFLVRWRMCCGGNLGTCGSFMQPSGVTGQQCPALRNPNVLHLGHFKAAILARLTKAISISTWVGFHARNTF